MSFLVFTSLLNLFLLFTHQLFSLFLKIPEVSVNFPKHIPALDFQFKKIRYTICHYWP